MSNRVTPKVWPSTFIVQSIASVFLLMSSQFVLAATFHVTGTVVVQVGTLQGEIQNYFPLEETLVSIDVVFDLAEGASFEHSLSAQFSNMSGSISWYDPADGGSIVTYTPTANVLSFTGSYSGPGTTGSLFRWDWEAESGPMIDGNIFGFGINFRSDVNVFEDPTADPFLVISNASFNGIHLTVKQMTGPSAYTTWIQTVRHMSSGDIQNISAVPLPTAIWFFSSALLGLLGLSSRKKV